MTEHTHRESVDEPVEILLVEDNPGDVRLTEEALKQTERETELRVVTTGDEAVEYLTQSGAHESASRPDLAFLDLNLPERSGVEVLEALGEEPELQRLPVIVLTSSEDDEDIANCYGANANAYLTKPGDHDEFCAVVKTVERFWFERARLPPIPA